MSKRGRHAAVMPQESSAEAGNLASTEAPAATATASEIETEAGSTPEQPASDPKTTDGWIDMQKPMSFEALHRATAVKSPFLAQNFT